MFIFCNQQLKYKKYIYFSYESTGRLQIKCNIFLFYYSPELELATDPAWSNCSDQWSMAKDRRNETFN